MDFEELDPQQTSILLTSSRRGGKTSDLAKRLAELADTGSSIYMTGMSESQLNALRTSLARRGVTLVVRTVQRDGAKGRVLLAKSGS